jgi:putative ABC transport system permease protein
MIVLKIVVLALLGLLGLAILLFVAAMLLCSLVLLGGLLAQLVGVQRRVPVAYNLRNLVVRWPTTLMTAVAFVVVVGLVIVMLAFLNGLYAITKGSGQPGNVMVLSDGATDELFSDLGFGDITRIQHEPGVEKDEEGQPLVSWETYVVVNQPVPEGSRTDRKRRFIQVRGVEDAARTARVHGLNLFPGGKFPSREGIQDLKSEGEKQEVATQAVLGEGIARDLGQDVGKPSLEVGDLFDLGDHKWVVVGILKSSGSTYNSEVWAKQQRVGEFFGKQSYTTVVLRTAGAEEAQQLADRLEAEYKQPAVSAKTETEYFESLNSTNLQFLVTILVVAIFLGVGGFLAVMIIMFAAISQRIRDIGVMRILGFSRWQILTSFFLEALVLAVLGGLLGCIVGALAHGVETTSILSSGPGGGKSVVLKLIVDWKVLLGGMLYALLMACIGGPPPALWATRVKPLEAVR